MSRSQSFHEFYAFYRAQHATVACRRWHFAGSLVALASLAVALASGQAIWLVGALLGGYGFAWIGHFFHEHNRPATFKHPFYSFVGDWRMFGDILLGRVKI